MSETYHKVINIEKNLEAYEAHGPLQKKVKRMLHHPYVELALVVLVVVLLSFLAIKAGFSLWILSKLSFSEHLGGGRGEPDFWNIGDELAAYKRRQAPGFKPEILGRAQATTN